MQDTARNSFIANVNLLVRQLKLLLELNVKFSKEDIASLTKLSDFIDSLMVLVDNIELLDEVHTELPEIKGLWKVVDELPGTIEQMRNEINAALADWENVEQDILPQLQDLKGIFTSVSVWTVDTSAEIIQGTYVEIPPYSYNYATLVVMLNGMNTREFDTIAPIETGSPNSKYIKFRDTIPAGTQIVGMTFVSPETVVIPEVVIHDTTLVGEGNSTKPLGVSPDIPASIVANNNAIVVVQNRMTTAEGKISAAENNIASNATNINSLNTEVTNINIEIIDIKNIMTQNTNTIEQLASNVESLEEENNTINQSVIDADTKITSNTERIEVLESGLSDTNIAVQSVYDDLVVLESKVDNLPTTEDLAEAIAEATPELTFASNASITTGGSTGTLTVNTLTNKGVAGANKTSAIPIVSGTSAGLMTSAIYNQVTALQAQLDGLTGSSYTIINDTIPENATQTALTAAWTESGEELVNGVTIENNALGLRWIYRNTLWYGPYTFTQATIATVNQLGVVKGVEDEPDNAGMIFVEQDGSQSLLGYDAIISRLVILEGGLGTATSNITALSDRATTLETNATTLTTRVGTAETNIGNNSSNITALQTRAGNIESAATALTTRVGAVETKATNNATDITSLKTKTDNTNTNVSTLTTRIGNAETAASTLTTRVTTAETNISSLNTAINSMKAKQWSTSILVAPPYVSGTAIDVPAYTMGKDSLDVFVNGIRTDRYEELTTTTIALAEGITSSDTIQLMIDCYKV